MRKSEPAGPTLVAHRREHAATYWLKGFALLWIFGALILAACSSSSASLFSPSAVKCPVTLANSTEIFVPEGGQGHVTVTTNPECGWEAATEAKWVSITSGVRGQGLGKVAYSVAPNDAPVARRGAIAVGDARVEVAQEAAPCRFQLSPSNVEVGASGGSGRISVAAREGCGWQAQASADWIRVVSGSEGNGPGEIEYRIARNSGPSSREGALTVGSARVRIMQTGVDAPEPPAPSPPPPEEEPPPPAPPPPQPPPPEPEPVCEFAISPAEAEFDATGGTGSVSVTAGDGCDWEVNSHVSWISIIGGDKGSGNGTVQYRVEGNTGTDARTGTLAIAHRTLTVRQSGITPPVCEYQIEPTEKSFDADGGDDKVEVQTGDSCAWTATSHVAWVTIEDGAAGTGKGDVKYLVAPNQTAEHRVGTLEIAGKTFTVQQEGQENHDDDDDNDDDQEHIELRGPVSSLSGVCPNLSFVVSERRVVTDQATRFRRDSCPRIQDGVRVEVRGREQLDSTVRADRVEVDDDDDEEDDDARYS